MHGQLERIIRKPNFSKWSLQPRSFYSYTFFVFVYKSGHFKCSDLEWLGLNRTTLDHPNTELVRYSSPHCSVYENIDLKPCVCDRRQYMKKICGGTIKEFYRIGPWITIVILNLQKALEYLNEYLEMESGESDIVICAHQLRKAIREIGFITGKVSSDKILDVIFSDFCIGK